MSGPVVSVIIPLYNKRSYITRALTSVASQTFKDYEVIVVDDGSTDGGGECAREFSSVPIRLITQPNGGPGIARARGMAEAAGEYLAFLDADDEWLPDFLTYALRLMHDFPTAGAAGTGYGRYDASGTLIPFEVASIPYHQPWRGILPDYFKASMAYPPLFSSSAIIPARVIKHLQPKASNARAGEDQYLWCQLGLEYPVAFDNRVLAVYHHDCNERLSKVKPVDGELPFIEPLRERLRDRKTVRANKRSMRAFIARSQLRTIRRIFESGGDLSLARYLYSRTPFAWICLREYVKWTIRLHMRILGLRTRVVAQLTGSAQQCALECFALAGKSFTRKNFRQATRRIEEYRRGIDWRLFTRTDNRCASEPSLSAIIVAYNTGEKLLACIQSLNPGPSTEVIVVDNGGNESVHRQLQHMNLCHIICPVNLMPSEGRNVGVSLARAPIIAFVDDDAVAAPGYAAAVLSAFSTYDVKGIRGRVLPPQGAQLSPGVGHYDYGEAVTFSPVNVEGNSAFLRTAYTQAQGMDPMMFGHEGMDISYRISLAHGPRSTIYWPSMVIYHDYAETQQKRTVKDARHALMWKYLCWKDRGVKRYRDDMRRLRNTAPAKKSG